MTQLARDPLIFSNVHSKRDNNVDFVSIEMSVGQAPASCAPVGALPDGGTRPAEIKERLSEMWSKPRF